MHNRTCIHLRTSLYIFHSQLYAVIEDEYGVTMFYEPEKMDLYNFMTERQKELTEKYAVQKIIQPLVETLEYLHTSQAVVHVSQLPCIGVEYSRLYVPELNNMVLKNIFVMQLKFISSPLHK